jgi:cell division protein FtsI (penicillin-binding protein 3)
MMNNNPQQIYPYRRWLILLVLGVCGLSVLWRLVDLQVLNKDFLQDQGLARHLRVVGITASRGVITDRHGEILAMSTPVDSVWANPRDMGMDGQQLARLARLLDMDIRQLRRIVSERGDREFVYLKRHLNPDLVEKVMALDIPGVATQREYRRYYPAGEVTAHIIGFTNIDDEGQEGLELAYDEWLRGKNGSKRVIRDRLGRVVENVESITEAHTGNNLRLSIDRRLQYIAYRELKAAVQQHKALSGSIVLLDTLTGEVLAMVNQPSYNPNNVSERHGGSSRNRAVTDVFEPGSTIKPFTIATALSDGDYTATTPVDTTPGVLKVGANTIKDVRNYGRIDVSTVIQKSSNVGVARIALSMPAEKLWQTFSDVGFGIITASGFPGESAGLLSDFHNWHEIEHATHAFGYGLSVTPLQLAQAYAVLAADGVRRPASFVHEPGRLLEPPEGQRVISKKIARSVRHMLELAVGDEGTGTLARVPGYRIAGKTGTVRKSGIGGYQEDRYIALFAGMAPASDPRLVMVVMINEPGNGEYYGGHVAAPVFSNVMFHALRLLNLPPDDLESIGTHLAHNRNGDVM